MTGKDLSEQEKVAKPYLRVSTDDKGQDPKRQMDLIRAWATREGVRLLEPTEDQGTSADKTDPFEREAFMEAIDDARDKGAQALVIETPDRLTRRGMGHYFLSVHNLKEKHRLKLWQSDQPLIQQDTFAGEIMSAIQAAMAQQWMERHKKAVRSGIDRARANGAVFGRKPKQFSDQEMAYIRDALMVPRFVSHHNKQGLTKNPAYKGYKSIAHEVNRMRGAYDVVDKAAREAKSVSEMTIRRIHKAMRAVQMSSSDKTRGVTVEG